MGSLRSGGGLQGRLAPAEEARVAAVFEQSLPQMAPITFDSALAHWGGRGGEYLLVWGDYRDRLGSRRSTMDPAKATCELASPGP